MTCGIYKIFNRVNEKIYVGESIDIEVRWNRHNYLLENNQDSSHLQNAWNKYGEEKFEFSIEKECLPEELKYWEEYYINFYDSANPEKGYNIEKYSNGVKIVSEETRKKLSDNSRGENNPNFGKICSVETKEKIREKALGREVSIETKQKLSEIRKGEKNNFYGKCHSEETKQKMSENHYDCNGENHPNHKLTLEKVEEIRQKYIPILYSIKKLSIEYNVSVSTISHILKNRSWKKDLV